MIQDRNVDAQQARILLMSKQACHHHLQTRRIMSQKDKLLFLQAKYQDTNKLTL
jgi:hypothetical protein